MCLVLQRAVLVSEDGLVSPVEEYGKASLTKAVLLSYLPNLFRKKKLMFSAIFIAGFYKSSRIQFLREKFLNTFRTGCSLCPQLSYAHRTPCLCTGYIPASTFFPHLSQYKVIASPPSKLAIILIKLRHLYLLQLIE